DTGRFMLINVPPGTIDLHFTGANIDAHLQVTVSANATLVISVRVSGNDAHLDDGHGNDDHAAAEVNGTIAPGSVAGSCAAHTLSFTVGATRIVTNASTIFHDGTCDALKAGSRVEVKGTRQADNSVLALSVEGEDDNDDNDNDRDGGVEVEGTIAAGSLAG